VKDRRERRGSGEGMRPARAAELGRELRSHRKRSAEGALDLPPFPEWAETLVTAKGVPYRFATMPYLEEIAQVFSNPQVSEAVLMKCVQVGASETLVRLLLYMALSQPLTCVYVFPARAQMADFRDARLIGLINANPDLRRHLGNVSNKGLMQFGPSFLYFRGAESIRDVISVDADLLFTDELDQINPDNLLEADRRVAASTLGLIRRVGVPTEPGTGIAALYEASDQRRWHVECPSCHDRQDLVFAENVIWTEDLGNIRDEKIVCRSCRSRLDLRHGCWIPSFPGRAVPGFHVNRLMVPGTNLKTLIAGSRRQDERGRRKFTANDLGLPFTDASVGLSRADLAAAVEAGTVWNNGVPLRQQSNYWGQNLVTAGVDPAGRRDFRVRISEVVTDPLIGQKRRRALCIRTVPGWPELHNLLLAYNATVVCVDCGSEFHSATAFTEGYPGSVYRVRELQMHTRPVRIDSESRTIQVDRTYLLDATCDNMRAGHNLLPEDLPPGYVNEMTSPRRRLTESPSGFRIARYEKTGRDDYAHAEGFDILAGVAAEFEEQSSDEIELIPITQIVDFEPSALWPDGNNPLLLPESDELEFSSNRWLSSDPWFVE
jgi:hypothetical protein